MEPSLPLQEKWEFSFGSLQDAALAKALAAELANRFELRLDLEPWLGRLPEDLILDYVILARAQALNALDHGRLQEAQEKTARWGVRSEGLDKVDYLLDQALIAREWTNWDQSSSLLAQVERLEPSPRQRLRLLNMQAVAALTHRADYLEAARLFTSIEKLAIRLQDHIAYLTSVINRGLGVERIIGRPEAMKECADIISRHYGGAIPHEDLPYFHRLQAEASLMSGDPDGPSAIEPLLLDPGGPNSAGYGHALLAYWHSQYGSLEESEDHALRASRGCLPFNSSVTIARLSQARCCARKGQGPEAENIVQSAWEAESSVDRRIQTALEGAMGQEMTGREEQALAWTQRARLLCAEKGLERDGARAEMIASSLRFDPKAAPALMEKIVSLGVFSLLARTTPRPWARFLGQCLTAGVHPDHSHRGLIMIGEPFVVVQCLGPLRLWNLHGEVPASSWRRPKARSLFAYLLSRRGGPVSILEALDDLWPEADPREARNSLRVAASYARQAISPLRIELEQGTVRLAEGCWTSVDLWRLLSGSPRSCSPETAAPFLDQEVFSDIQDEWVDAARAQAQARARQILTAAS